MIVYKLPNGELTDSPKFRIERLKNPKIIIGLMYKDTFIPLNKVRKYNGDIEKAAKM